MIDRFLPFLLSFLMESKRFWVLLASMLLLPPLLMPNVRDSYQQTQSPPHERKSKIVEKKLHDLPHFFLPYKHVGNIDVDSVSVFSTNKIIHVYFSDALTHIPVRKTLIDSLNQISKDHLGWRFRNYDIRFFARGKSIQNFIPQIYQEENAYDQSKIFRKQSDKPPLVTRHWQENYPGGLSGNHIALWHSHGLYYNQKKQRWQWQRARLFSTVEDIFPMEYTLKYIAPMLENAGANVLMPRERDLQTNEVIVDNDQSSTHSTLEFTKGTSELIRGEKGFLLQDTIFNHDNPFHNGTHVIMESNSGGELTYIPDIPEKGYYAVYLSWAKHPENLEQVNGEIKYAGGTARFSINQQMGHGTWVYLGTFYFEKGKNPDMGSLVIYSFADEMGVITADAAKFGGGMGNVARRSADQKLSNQRSVNDDEKKKTHHIDKDSFDDQDTWKISGYPRYSEGARYFLQYAGFPDSLVYSLNEGKNDYNDDYMSRGEWVNYLMGSPLGPTGANQSKGLNIPVDLSLAFHTDAGITQTDSVIGTLAIYSATRDEGLFPDGIPRMTSRDLSDIVQEQIVQDIRALHKPDWTQRALWDREYSEAWRPNVPALLLELLSHQNLSDMQYGLDPRFQFDVSRAIYKGIARFIAHQQQKEAVIQPLPPSHFAIDQTDKKTIRLSWKAMHDPLEPSAKPLYFKLYKRIGNKGFDTGTRIDTNYVEWELGEWETIYSFKVTAVNEGGESFPTETLAAGFVKDQQHTLLVVNGFDRISAPGVFDTGELAGLTWWDDHAIPYQRSASFTGMQYDYQRNSPWLDDDSPGWGASYASHEKEVVAGNLFDYPAWHGDAILHAGYSFVSMSRKAFENMPVNPGKYPVIDLIMGKQKTISFPGKNDQLQFELFSDSMMDRIEEHTQHGVSIMITGAYIGTDPVSTENQRAIDFNQNTLGYLWRTNNATSKGEVVSTKKPHGWFPEQILFNTEPHHDLYAVEAPDGLEPADKNSFVPYRYATNNISAAVVYQANNYTVFAAGFPFESITSQQQRNDLMKSILKLFNTGM